jgi:beta-fructofuranosidase
VLITSQGQPVDWFVGDFDRGAGTFTAESRGTIDHGAVYAPSVLVQNVEFPILFGWVNGVPGGKGWRHCQTIPRELRLDAEGRLVQRPAPALEALRDRLVLRRPARYAPFDASFEPPATLHARMVALLRPGGGTAGLRFGWADDAKAGFDLTFDGATLTVGDRRISVEHAPGTPLKLHLFLDASILEVTTDDGLHWATRVEDGLAQGLVIDPIAEDGGLVESLEVDLLQHMWVDGPDHR